MNKRKVESGQGIVELAVILPVLLILLLGVVEIGYALRDYLVIVNACREGGRFAARGRFSDTRVGERVVSAGGYIGTGGSSSTDMPFLRTTGPDPNTAIIITHIPMDPSGEVPSYTVWVSGTVPITGGVRTALAADSRVSIADIVNRHGGTTRDINATRVAAGYEAMHNHIVVVEVIFMHHPLWNNPLVPLPDPWVMHARSEMRVVSDREAR